MIQHYPRMITAGESDGSLLELSLSSSTLTDIAGREQKFWVWLFGLVLAEFFGDLELWGAAAWSAWRLYTTWSILSGVWFRPFFCIRQALGIPHGHSTR